jgi:hypothetical protein
MRSQASDTSSSIAAGSSLPVDDDRHAKPGTRAWSSVLAAVGRHEPSELMRSWATLWVVQSVASEDPSAGGEVPSADGPRGNVRAPLHGACLLGVLGIMVVLRESSARLRAGADHGRRSALSIKPWSKPAATSPRFERRRPQAITRAGRRTPAPLGTVSLVMYVDRTTMNWRYPGPDEQRAWRRNFPTPSGCTARRPGTRSTRPWRQQDGMAHR